MRYRMLGVIAALGLLTACGDGKPQRVERPGHVLTGLEGTKPGAPLGDSGCYFLSGDGLRAACLEHEVDMGELTTTVTFHDLAQRGRVTAKHVVFLGMTGDDREKAGIKPAELAKVNKAFSTGGFAVEGKPDRGNLPVVDDGTNLRWTYDEKTGASTRPRVGPLEGAKNSAKCCTFEPTSATYFRRGEAVAAFFELTCRYHSDASKGDDCYDPQMNDETTPRASRVRVIKLR